MTSAESLPAVAVIVPVYRNAPTLPELARRAEASLSGAGFEARILFVVDASPDDSWAVVQDLSARNSRVSGLLLDRNHGQHRALLLGLAHLDAQAYAILDADLQDPPELLAAMAERCLGEACTVFATRTGLYQGLGRMLTSRLLKSLLSLMTGLPVNAGTYIMMPRAAARRMTALTVTPPHVPVMAWMCSEARAVLAYGRAERTIGQSAYSGWGRLRAGLRALRCAWALRRVS